MHHRTAAVVSALLLCALVSLGGCGSSKDKAVATDGADAATMGTGMITHEQGTITIVGKSVLLTRDKGGKMEFTIGEMMAAGQLAALASSGEKVRLYHRGSVAVRVDKAPVLPPTAESLTGAITQVSETGISLKGDAGTTDFVIRPADQPAFAVAHLKAHEAAHLPITVYFETKGGKKLALAYEDA